MHCIHPSIYSSVRSIIRRYVLGVSVCLRSMRRELAILGNRNQGQLLVALPARLVVVVDNDDDVVYASHLSWILADSICCSCSKHRLSLRVTGNFQIKHDVLTIVVNVA